MPPEPEGNWREQLHLVRTWPSLGAPRTDHVDIAWGRRCRQPARRFLHLASIACSALAMGVTTLPIARCPREAPISLFRSERTKPIGPVRAPYQDGLIERWSRIVLHAELDFPRGRLARYFRRDTQTEIDPRGDTAGGDHVAVVYNPRLLV